MVLYRMQFIIHTLNSTVIPLFYVKLITYPCHNLYAGLTNLLLVEYVQLSYQFLKYQILRDIC